MYQYSLSIDILILLIVSLSGFYDLTQLQNRVCCVRCTLWTIHVMYKDVTHVYRVSTLFTLYQYQTTGISMLWPHSIVYKITTIILSARLSRSYACLLVLDLQRPESFSCELSKRQCGRCIECGGREICEHKGVAASAGSEEVAAHASTSDSAASSRWIMHALRRLSGRAMGIELSSRL